MTLQAQRAAMPSGRSSTPSWTNRSPPLGSSALRGLRRGRRPVHLRLPTPQCAPNFAYLMTDDARAAISSVPGVGAISVTLDDHYTGTEINAAVARGGAFADAFPGETRGDLTALRLLFRRKALVGRQARVCEELARDHEDAAICALRVRELLADRYRVDARLLTPNARVDGVDTRAGRGGACGWPAWSLRRRGDAAERLQAWEGAHAAGLPVCRALAALDDEPGPLLVLEPPPPRALAGDGSRPRRPGPPARRRPGRAGAARRRDRGRRPGPRRRRRPRPRRAAARRAGGRSASRGRAPGRDRGRGAGRRGPAAPTERPPDPPPGGRGRCGCPGRRGMWRGAALAVAAAAALLLVGGSVRHGGQQAREPAPAAAHSPLAPPSPPHGAAGAARPQRPQPPTPLRETAAAVRAPARGRHRVPGRRPAAHRGPCGPVPPPRPAARLDCTRRRHRVRRCPAGPAGRALGPDSPLGPPGPGRRGSPMTSR